MQNKIQARDYQVEAVQAFFNYFNEGNTGNPILYVAGGGGKSVIIAMIIKRILSEFSKQRVIISASSQDLVGQNFSKLAGLMPEANLGLYSAGLGKKQPWCDVVYGGIQSMYCKTAALGHRDLLFIDECQDLSPENEGMYMQFIADLKAINPYLKVIGFSATPWRTKGGSLLNQKNAIFTDIIVEITQKFLTEEGYLVPLIGKSSKIQANLKGVNITSSGEFNLKKAETAIDNEELMIAALDDVGKWASDRKNFLFFSAGLTHAAHATEILNKRGYNPTLITGKTEKKTERPAILNNFRNSGFSKKQSLVNNAVLTTGTDLPNIDCIVLWRATASSVLYVQILSRGTRPVYAPGYDLNTKEGRLAAIANSSKPNCLILCYAGNVERFGAIDLIQIPKEKRGQKENGQPSIAPQKICPNCREPVLIMVKTCPSCDHEFQFDEGVKHGAYASSAAVSSFEIIPERFAVNTTKYSSGVDKNGNIYVRISYYDGWGLIASEFVHFAYRKAQLVNWFNERRQDAGELYCPQTAEELLARQDEFKIPLAIWCKKSGKYQEVTDYEFR